MNKKCKKFKKNLTILLQLLIKKPSILNQNNLKNTKEFKNKIIKDNQNQKSKKKMNWKKNT